MPNSTRWFCRISCCSSFQSHNGGEDAVKHAEIALQVAEETYGALHPHTVKAVGKLADVYGKFL